MSERKLFYPERFKTASRYYTTGRPAYPKLLSRRVAQLVGLDRGASVLDLATGPGFLAIDFAPHTGPVTAVDPSPEMLSAARENAARAGVSIRCGVSPEPPEQPDRGAARAAERGRRGLPPEHQRITDSLATGGPNSMARRRTAIGRAEIVLERGRIWRPSWRDRPICNRRTAIGRSHRYEQGGLGGPEQRPIEIGSSNELASTL